MPQLVELDIFFEAFERGVAGELLEAGDVDPLRDVARDRPTPQAPAGRLVPSNPVQRLTISAIEAVSIGLGPIR